MRERDIPEEPSGRQGSWQQEMMQLQRSNSKSRHSFLTRAPRSAASATGKGTEVGRNSCPMLGPRSTRRQKQRTAAWPRNPHRPCVALETVGGRVGSAARYSSPDASAKHRNEEILRAGGASLRYRGSGWHGRGGRPWRPQRSGPDPPGPVAKRSNAGDSGRASCNGGTIAGRSIDRAAERHPGELHTVHRG